MEASALRAWLVLPRLENLFFILQPFPIGADGK
jgi:hypothetical protein